MTCSTVHTTHSSCPFPLAIVSCLARFESKKLHPFRGLPVDPFSTRWRYPARDTLRGQSSGRRTRLSWHCRFERSGGVSCYRRFSHACPGILLVLIGVRLVLYLGWSVICLPCVAKGELQVCSVVRGVGYVPFYGVFLLRPGSR